MFDSRYVILFFYLPCDHLNAHPLGAMPTVKVFFKVPVASYTSMLPAELKLAALQPITLPVNF